VEADLLLLSITADGKRRALPQYVLLLLEILTTADTAVDAEVMHKPQTLT